MAKKTTQSVRLPRHIIPEKYLIKLTPDLENFTFVGEEEIVLSISKRTSSVTLHAIEIAILSAEIVVEGDVLSGKTLYQEKEETATITFPKEIKQGSAVLIIKFTGILNDKMRGFYRSGYEFNGKRHHMAVTQFESTDARRAFPSFDEPDKKAVFEVELTVPSDRAVISNTIETEILEHDAGIKTVKFAPTPVMSSYLLAFIVGHFEHIERKNEDGVLVRVFVTPGKKKQAEFALDVACRVLSFYTKYFKIPYPLPVLDLIAIPDFAAGAMENWGAITYRETALLVDTQLSSTQNKQWVALVIAHEIAHQWFGNLVTMEWWTHLWLNEGFASYMEYVAIDSLYPEWHIWSQFVYIEHSRALALDGLKSTHPIEVEVGNPAEISEIFDEVSYSKGASVIRMLAEYLGEKSFRDGLRAYLLKHKYANATTRDLWISLGKVSGKKVAQIMDAWTREPGYPRVKFANKNGAITLTQSRFFSSPLLQKSQSGKTIWPIPLNILTPTSTKQQYFMLDREKSNLPASLSKGAFVKINARETSFVRVDYGDYLETLEAPIQSKNQSFRPSDRFGIVRDAFALAEAGKLATDKVLRLVLSYQEEEAYIVWAEIASNLMHLSHLLSEEKYYLSYCAYVRRSFARIGRHLGWEKRKNETHSHTLLRSSVLYMLGHHGDKKTIEHAKELFKLENEGKINIKSDLRGVVFNLVAENGGKVEYKIFLSMFEKATLEEEKDRILRALSLFPDKKLLIQTLNFAFSPEMHGQDAAKAINFVWGNRFGRDVAWKYLKENWDDIFKRFGGGHMYTKFVKPAENFSTHVRANEVKRFFQKKNKEGIARTIDQALEKINSSASWLQRDRVHLAKFLSQF